MKRLSLLLAIAACVGMATASAQVGDDIEVYYTVDELANLRRCLPPPPAFGSAEFKNDSLRYEWGKRQRLDVERAQIAARDAVWSFDSLLVQFSVPFGMPITREGTPEIYKAVVSGIATIEQMRVEPKAYYHRLRPFEYFGEHMLTIEEEDDLRGEGSYPSGHTIRGWSAALLLAEINPAAADTIFARGWMYGESRVIVGAHWQSDVDVSRAAASIGYSLLQTSGAFRHQMDLARAEFAILRRMQQCCQQHRDSCCSSNDAVRIEAAKNPGCAK